MQVADASPRLFGASRGGPFVDAVTHKVLELAQRVEVSHEEDDLSPKVAPQRAPLASGPKRVVTGRAPPNKAGSVSLLDIIEAGLLSPGKGNLSISYKGVTYTASLLRDGTIEYQGQVFQTASALGIHCKRLITPNKQGDDGWKSVHYQGKPLDYFRKQYQERILGEAGQGVTAAAPSTEAAAAAEGTAAAASPTRNKAAAAAAPAAGASAMAALVAAAEEADSGGAASGGAASGGAVSGGAVSGGAVSGGAASGGAGSGGAGEAQGAPKLGRRALAKAQAAAHLAQQRLQEDEEEGREEAQASPHPPAAHASAGGGSGRQRRGAAARANAPKKEEEGEAAGNKAEGAGPVASPNGEESKGRRGSGAAARGSGKRKAAARGQAEAETGGQLGVVPKEEGGGAAEPMDVDAPRAATDVAAGGAGGEAAQQAQQQAGQGLDVKVSARIAARMQQQQQQGQQQPQQAQQQQAAAVKAPAAAKKSSGKAKAGAPAASTLAAVGKGSGAARGKRGKAQLPAAAIALSPGGQPLMIDGQLVVELPEGAAGLEPSDQWVQCDRCGVWRLVPNKWWQAVQEDEREEWHCEYAQWDVRKMLPHKPPCKR